MSALIKPIGMLKSYIGGQAEISVEEGDCAELSVGPAESQECLCPKLPWCWTSKSRSS